ncbi:hypothetical protein F2Q70_00032646 [Brassica cretica]|uniref:Uncharacterized protein n=1 Tax=Brassica cretica TaxID=69181 RepID=A0A8S9FHX8_BRACR|nr:hypothetical protein F2Q70_00032646 [Brassica cretica]
MKVGLLLRDSSTSADGRPLCLPPPRLDLSFGTLIALRGGVAAPPFTSLSTDLAALAAIAS